MKSCIKIIVFCLLCICCEIAVGQRSYLDNNKPGQGEKVRVHYVMKNDERPAPGEQVFSGIQYWNESGAYFKKTVALKRVDDANWSAVLDIPADAAYLRIRFYRLSTDDDEAALSSMIYHRGVPARGATYQDFNGNQLQLRFREEIKRYPDNYFAYARYIAALPADTLPTMLPDLIAKLLKVKNADDGVLSALTVAYSRQGEKEMAQAALLQLLEKYPASTGAEFSLSLFLYEQYKTGGSMFATGILLDKLKEIFVRFPQCGISTAYNNIATLSGDKSIPVEAFESAVQALYLTGRIDYNSMSVLPNLYLRRNIKLDAAADSLKRIINIFNSGEIYHQYRLPPTYTYTYVTQYLRTLAKVNLRQQKPADAVVILSATLQQVKGSNFEESLRPVLELELADAYSKAGNYAVSLDHYKRIYRAGNKKVKDSIEQLYLKMADRSGLDKFIADTVKVNPVAGNAELAPAFSGLDLTGKEINLADYKGKTVVINAWFIGCVPCIAEMPELNKLVEDYKGRNDVVFLALTPDKTEALNKFLSKTEFKYKVINNLKGIEAYNISAYPQHLVIDKEGKIIYRNTGAVPGISDVLKRAIDR